MQACLVYLSSPTQQPDSKIGKEACLFQDVLRHLGGFAAASGALYDDNSALLQCLQKGCSPFMGRQRRPGITHVGVCDAALPSSPAFLQVRLLPLIPNRQTEVSRKNGEGARE